ncbi:hypothetical protein SAMN04488494_0323 [Xylanibacter ruminicola]|uniref:Uncharacterized protein n=1 Tax=Xylanibacter ruminicola TaxID=839 RepID=A0A1M7P3I9_XYLRU|nr:hypothetical protein [Xylanibacter ruminicola]SFC69236.1 hypothetical protein SAMN04488493_1152 [Xylanibacter ruminicola]SHN11044.1 hypothetical protein SAMN04488494_0323 [Xylanibacter ruminicola]
MDRKERRKRMIMKMNVVEYVLRAGCAVIVLAFVAIIAFWGGRVYEVYFKPTYPLMPEGGQLYDTDSIGARDSMAIKEMPKQEPQTPLPTSSSSSKRSSYRPNDNMQRFDPPSEDDMDDNGMSRYMNAYDDEDWE